MPDDGAPYYSSCRNDCSTGVHTEEQAHVQCNSLPHVTSCTTPQEATDMEPAPTFAVSTQRAHIAFLRTQKSGASPGCNKRLLLELPVQIAAWLGTSPCFQQHIMSRLLILCVCPPGALARRSVPVARGSDRGGNRCLSRDGSHDGQHVLGLGGSSSEVRTKLPSLFRTRNSTSSSAVRQSLLSHWAS